MLEQAVICRSQRQQHPQVVRHLHWSIPGIPLAAAGGRIMAAMFRSHSMHNVANNSGGRVALRDPQSPGKYGHIHFFEYSRLIHALDVRTTVPFMFLAHDYDNMNDGISSGSGHER